MAAQSAQLVAIGEGPNILLDKPIMLIGRHQECDIQIPSRKISRRHCCIAQVNDHFAVRDLCSTNGIRINGVRVNDGRLNPGDELTIGSFRYQVQCGVVPGKMEPPRLPDENDQLESCDVPVPLAEPEAPREQAGSPFPGHAKEIPATSSPSLIFPDNIQLAPLSDSGLNHAK